MEFVSKILAFLNGKKTYIGLLVTLLAFLAGWLPEALAAAHVSPELAAKIVGGIVTVGGLLHKLVKLISEESK